MKTDCKVRKDAKNLKIERVFETSRLAGELMACAYENIVPISRRPLNTTKKIELPRERWFQNKDEQKCVMGL